MSSVWFFVHLFLDSGFPGCAAMGASDEGDVQRRRLCDATADELPPPHCLSLSQHLRDASMVAFFVLRWVMVILRAGDTVVSAISKLLDFGGAEVVHYIIQREQMKIIRARGSASFTLEKHMLNYPKYNHNRCALPPVNS
ncbi:hypothetical protein EJB05_45839 [Eragrostis curvula]|uniref:Uncharacterized protein n=1 Tax=Eragrostis curvula TaxID=38414 RepID=A0A5J9TL72_9POAL|nr:hypothetical protein EJB05_45839 [Eragrostis curvula]